MVANTRYRLFIMKAGGMFIAGVKKLNIRNLIVIMLYE